MQRDVGVIIVAAGSGSRTGPSELKQFRWVAGKPMLLHSIQTFQARPDVAMVVVRASARVRRRSAAVDLSVRRRTTASCPLADGTGATPSANGLEDLPTECEIVVIHDAARPLVAAETIGA